ncbi:MAG: transcription antitermination factor NusB [Microthrixaceae bacterium]
MIEPGPAPRVRPVVGGRAPARERALHLLYEADATGSAPPDVLASQAVAADRYAEHLVAGVHDHRERIETLVAELLPESWTFARLAVLDRTILQIAVYELIDSNDVPTAVVLSEAVRLAETYGTDDSPRFVNGLLAAAARNLRDDYRGD